MGRFPMFAPFLWGAESCATRGMWGLVAHCAPFVVLDFAIRQLASACDDVGVNAPRLFSSRSCPHVPDAFGLGGTLKTTHQLDTIDGCKLPRATNSLPHDY
jgi:hypothetical protein